MIQCGDCDRGHCGDPCECFCHRYDALESKLAARDAELATALAEVEKWKDRAGHLQIDCDGYERYAAMLRKYLTRGLTADMACAVVTAAIEYGAPEWLAALAASREPEPAAQGGRGIPRTEDDGERRGNIHPAAQVRKICPCETLVEEPGPHIPECPYSDPDYEPAAQARALEAAKEPKR